jgi:shikimate 5-dehydrogenase
MIDKDTKIYCSFSINPGNNGCIFFNNAFKEKNINAIYKSFYSNNIKNSIDAVKALNISGFAISIPFKVETLNYVDEVSNEVQKIGACNTVLNNNGRLTAYNTDYSGVRSYIENLHLDIDFLYILGNGGFSKSIQYTCDLLNLNFEIIDRKNWYKLSKLKNKWIFNATPIEVNMVDNNVIDGRPFTQEGKIISYNQSIQQFKLYTGINYDD